MRVKRLLRSRRGFSFVELIAVLIIIAILASIGVPVYLEQVKNARAAEAQTTIAAIRTAAKMYRQKYGKFPPGKVEELVKKKFVEIDEATELSWNFDLDYSSEKLRSITATSTEKMPGGAGQVVTYDAVQGKWSGYGQDDE